MTLRFHPSGTAPRAGDGKRGGRGFAFDGDADRVIATDERGNIVDGDRILGMCAKVMHDAGSLHGDTLVVTVMSNIGLKQYMRNIGIHVAETAVGDRYVLECMLEGGYSWGANNPAM